jgi:uncharacterized LabA/DUF88 family protein
MPLNNSQKLKLNGKTAVFIDYANVYGWRDELANPVDPTKLFRYLKSYPKIKLINLYYGSDTNPQSKDFLKKIVKIGYNLTTKAVKYIIVGKIDGQIIKKRKCDFDIEICMSVYECLAKKYDSFIFFSGDGDFAPLYTCLISHHKQVIVVYTKGHIGREIWEIKKGLFKIQIDQLPI